MAREGVIRFDLQFTPGTPVSMDSIRTLNAWRRVLWQLGLIGRDPHRYGGEAFGNVSRRIAPAGTGRFVISGTRTGEREELDVSEYSIVEECAPRKNRVVATGPVKPSSESLTHGVLYDLDANIQAILHVHSPPIWKHAPALGLPCTVAAVSYGTPQMAQEAGRLFRETAVRHGGIFIMGGHEDGVVAFGTSPDQAGQRLLGALVKSYALQ
jgi:ribulose-5-phosphate 4-epimerase/fuculose-1-phosphate aldolase